MIKRTTSRFLSGLCRIHPFVRSIAINPPWNEISEHASGRCPWSNQVNSTNNSNSEVLYVVHWDASGTDLSDCPLTPRCIAVSIHWWPESFLSCRTRPAVQSQLSRMKQDWQQQSPPPHPPNYPSLTLHHLSFSFSLHLPRWLLDSGRRGKQTDLCGCCNPPLPPPPIYSRLPHSPVTVWRPYWTPLSPSPDWSFLTPTHALSGAKQNHRYCLAAQGSMAPVRTS